MKWKKFALFSFLLACFLECFIGSSTANALDLRRNVHYAYSKDVSLEVYPGTVSSWLSMETGYYYYVIEPESGRGLGQVRGASTSLWTPVDVSAEEMFDFNISFFVNTYDPALGSCPIIQDAPYVFDDCSLEISTFDYIASINVPSDHGVFDFDSSIISVYNYHILGHFTSSTTLSSFHVSFSPLSYFSTSKFIIGINFSDITIFNYDPSNIEGILQQGNNQSHEDSQAQLDWDKQQAEKEEDKANESLNNDGSSAEIDTSQGTNALNVFINIAKTTGGSCSIGPIEAYGFNLGTLNLCHYTPPEWVQTAFAAVTGLALTWTSFLLIRRVVDEVIRSYKR